MLTQCKQVLGVAPWCLQGARSNTH